MEIRKAELNDLPQLAKLFDAYRVFYQKETSLKEAEEFLKARLTGKDSEIIVASDEEGKLTGFVQLYPLFSSTRMKRLWLLNDLFVAENERGKGISIELINQAKQLCVESKACGMMLETAKSNIIGNKLYLKTGFILDDEHNYYSWDN